MAGRCPRGGAGELRGQRDYSQHSQRDHDYRPARDDRHWSPDRSSGGGRGGADRGRADERDDRRGDRENSRPEEPAPEPQAIELDSHRLSQRQKQIDFGKNTIGYDNYLRKVPRCPTAWPRLSAPRDRRRLGKDPMTPDIHAKISKRCFDGRIKVWRRCCRWLAARDRRGSALHRYDHPESKAPPAGGQKAEPAAKAAEVPADQ